MAFQKKYSKYIKPILTENNFVFWFSFSNPYDSEIILFGNVYIPPENSVYAIDDLFNEIQNELSKLRDKYSHICMLGDYNSRTHFLKDYIELDRTFFLDQIMTEHLDAYDTEMNFFLKLAKLF